MTDTPTWGCPLRDWTQQGSRWTPGLWGPCSSSNTRWWHSAPWGSFWHLSWRHSSYSTVCSICGSKVGMAEAARVIFPLLCFLSPWTPSLCSPDSPLPFSQVSTVPLCPSSTPGSPHGTWCWWPHGHRWPQSWEGWTRTVRTGTAARMRIWGKQSPPGMGRTPTALSTNHNKPRICIIWGWV